MDGLRGLPTQKYQQDSPRTQYPTSDDSETDEDDGDLDCGMDTDEDLQSDDDDLEWAHCPKVLRGLEELRGCFASELEDPSAWTLQRMNELTQGARLFAAREMVRHWLSIVAQSTKTPLGEKLQLPETRLPRGLPFHKVLTWEEANALVGAAREDCFGHNMGGRYRRDAWLTIRFLFPEAATKGLSERDKKRIYNIALRIWTVDHRRAEALLWALDNEFTDTRAEIGRVREWPNSMSKDFMTYTALYPPPIVMDN